MQAALTGSELVAVHAWQRPADRRERHPLPITADDPQRRAVTESLSAALVAWSWRLPQVAVQPMVVPDLDVPYTLDRASRRARLLVAGTGGRGGLTNLLDTAAGRPGGQHKLCPVLLVPPDWAVDLPAEPRREVVRASGSAGPAAFRAGASG
jgi:hypothetical protein